MDSSKQEKSSETFTNRYNLPDPVCINKFAWSTIHFSVAQSMSCHRVAGDPITPETYHNFHNTPSKIKDRELMLNGQWPITNGPEPLKPHFGCEVCREVESAGGISERLMMNANYNLHELVPKEIKEDGAATFTTPTILEVFFGNQCNLACIYCTPKCSSMIAAEHFRYSNSSSIDEVKYVSDKRKDYPQLLEAHWAWMRENARYLKRYQILGGEPFYQKELEQNIDFFMENKCPNLEVLVFSNLKVEKEKFRKILDKIKSLLENNHVKTFTLFCSFDCWGPQIEYIRHGLNLEKWEENFLILLREYPQIDLYIHSTLTALTFDTLPELCRKIKEWMKIGPVHHSISTVDSRPFLHPGIFSNGFYERKINEAVEAYKEIINVIRDETPYGDLIKTYYGVIAQLRGYEKTFNAHALDIDNIRELKKYLDTNDFRRKTDWKQLWPWLDQYPT